LAERGLELIHVENQDWEFIYQSTDNPIRDGRAYNVNGNDFLSFYFTTGYTSFHFTSQGIMWVIATSDPAFRTAAGVGIGDSRERVLEVYGNAFMTQPFVEGETSDNEIEYFDGENYIAFVIINDIVTWLRVSTEPIFAREMHW